MIALTCMPYVLIRTHVLAQHTFGSQSTTEGTKDPTTNIQRNTKEDHEFKCYAKCKKKHVRENYAR